MRESKGQSFWSLAVTALLLGLGTLAAAHAAEDVVTRRNDKFAGASANFWRSTQAEAIPMPLGTREGKPVMPHQFAPPGPAGLVQGSPPGMAAGSFTPQVSIANGTVEPAIFGGAQWYAYPPPHARYFPRFGLTFYPHTTLGKLFFSDGFNNFVCSGAAVTCGNLNLVMTAGHCCAAGNGSTWYDDFLFVPACFGANCNLGAPSAAPFGVWDWESVTVSSAWFNFGDLARDVCFLETAPNGALQELHQVVGSLGFAWNQPQPMHYTMTGWPAAPPFSGGNLVFEVGSTADLDATFSPNTVGVGNFMTGGSSGGAWIKDYKQGNGNMFWNGLNSYKYNSPARPDEMYGPYIDTTTFNTWGASVGCQ